MKLDDLADDASHCARCGKRLPTDGWYGHRKFCSKKCQREDYGRLAKAALREEKAKQGRKCRHCDGPISVEKNSKAVYCSTHCQMQHFYHHKRHRYPGTCKICGDRFEGHNARQIYCSPKCRAKAGVMARRKRKQSAFLYI